MIGCTSCFRWCRKTLSLPVIGSSFFFSSTASTTAFFPLEIESLRSFSIVSRGQTYARSGGQKLLCSEVEGRKKNDLSLKSSREGFRQPRRALSCVVTFDQNICLFVGAFVISPLVLNSNCSTFSMHQRLSWARGLLKTIMPSRERH